MMEYVALNDLCSIEDKLYIENRIGLKSGLMNSLEKAVIDSGRWKKWLKESEKEIEDISEERKDWIIKTSARYVWANPEVRCPQKMLYKNLELNGIDGEGIVLSNIEKAMDRYFREFNLIDLNYKLI